MLFRLCHKKTGATKVCGKTTAYQLLSSGEWDDITTNKDKSYEHYTKVSNQRQPIEHGCAKAANEESGSFTKDNGKSSNVQKKEVVIDLKSKKKRGRPPKAKVNQDASNK